MAFLRLVLIYFSLATASLLFSRSPGEDESGKDSTCTTYIVVHVFDVSSLSVALSLSIASRCGTSLASRGMSWLSGLKTAVKLDDSCDSVTDLISFCVHPQWLAQSILTPVSKEIKQINQTLNKIAIGRSDVNIGGKKTIHNCLFHQLFNCWE